MDASARIARLSAALLAALAALVAAFLVLAAAAHAAGRPRCEADSYSYAGVMASTVGYGVAATITPLRVPATVHGHVAAWAGVGGYGLGPGGSDEWLQVGISKLGSRAPALYYELTLPHRKPRYVLLRRRVSLDHSYRVALLESSRRPGWWSVWVDGRQLTGPIHLPGSHGAWAPVATAESWNRGSPSCNAFAFRFSNVVSAARPGGGWTPLAGRVLEYPGYRVVQSRGALLALGPR